ncbi:MAG: Pup--protein ligase [Actinomycetota bacterium]|nr:Pup--protein ligase [Actinomycetota bacterium]
MRRRVFGLETEYGISCTVEGRRGMPTEDVARRLFRNVVSWGRTSNVFLENGSRLYLDVGSHPEYATPECSSAHEVVVHERAGDRILDDLRRRTQADLDEEGIAGRVRIFRNNTDFSGNSYGSHENYLVERHGEFQPLADALLPFLVTRQIFAGAGKVLLTARGAVYVLSQRAEHIWEGVSSATTRSRPVINSRDEPHADAERYRRLHVIVGDSNMSDLVTWLRVASCDLVIRLVEEGGALEVPLLESATRAIREVSRDLSGRGAVRLADGRDLPAIEVQRHYLEAVERFLAERHPDDLDAQHVVGEWRRVLTALDRDPMSLEGELDWVAKLRLVQAYQDRNGVGMEDPRIGMLDLAYHDIAPESGLHQLLVRQGRMASLVAEDDVLAAMDEPPRTRALLRGRFLRAAKEHGRDVTVDWVHLKLNGEAPRTLMCKDPLIWDDVRVDRLIEEMAVDR